MLVFMMRGLVSADNTGSSGRLRRRRRFLAPPEDGSASLLRIERLLLRAAISRGWIRGCERLGNVGDLLAGWTSNLPAADLNIDLQTPTAVRAVESE